MLLMDKHLDFDKYFKASCAFLHKFKWIFECSNVNFIRENVLDNMPAEWIEDFSRCSWEDELNKIPEDFVKDDWSDTLKDFLSEIKSLNLTYEPYSDMVLGTSIKGISLKKQYEISRLAALIGSCCHVDDVLVDFGCGLGYLSQLVHEKYGLKVVGLDGNDEFVNSAAQRQSKYFKKSAKDVHYKTHLITEDSSYFIINEVANLFPLQQENSLAIIGLHACADLTITAIQLFLQTSEIKRLVIMPCCYHKLKKQKCEDPNSFINMPLSRSLKKHLDTLQDKIISRPFLRLASQESTKRWKIQTEEQHEKHGRAMFERAFVEALLEEGQIIKLIEKGEITLNWPSIQEKYEIRNNVMDSKIPWNDFHKSKFDALFAKYSDGWKLAEYLTCFQICLQNICENIVILDRLKYLNEMSDRLGLEMSAKILKFEDDALSPRCFVLVAEKL